MRRAAAPLTLALLLGSAAAGARQPEQAPRWVGFRYLGGSAELQYETETEERVTKGSGALTRVDHALFTEVVELDWGAFVYHPRFLDLKGKVGLTLEQGDIAVTTGASSDSASRGSTRPLFSLSGAFLAQHPVSLTFGLTRQTGTIDQGFAGRADLDSSSENATLHINNALVPTEVFYYHSRSLYTQRGIGEDRDDEETRYGFTMRHETSHSSSNLFYQYSDATDAVTDPAFGNLFDDVFDDVILTPVLYVAERRRHEASLTNLLHFGADDRSWLRSAFRYYDEQGTNPTSRLSLDEILHLAHTDRLATDYSVNYSQYSVRGSDTETLSGRVGLSHQLYDSLFTDLEVHASQEQFGGFTRDVGGGSVSWRYRKTIPHGVLLLNLGFGYETTDEMGRASARPVLDEPHELDDAVTELLDNPDVIEATIVVTNPAGTVLYFRDFDYRVIVRGRLIELRRITTGRIDNGDPVVVDYSFEITTPISYATTNYRYRAQVDLFEHVSLYAGVRGVKNKLRSGLDEGRLQDVVDTLIGTRLTWGPATLTVEHQDYDSTQAPYVSDVATLDVRHELNRVHALGFGATHRHVVYEEGQDLTSRAVSASYVLTPFSGPTIEVSGGYEQSDDREFSSNHTFARVEARYRIRATEIEATFWLRDRDDDFATQTRSYFLFTVRREF